MSWSHDQVSVLQAMGIDVWSSNETTEEDGVPVVDDRVYRVVQTRCQASGEPWLWLLGEKDPTVSEWMLLKKIIQAVKLEVVERQSLSLSELQGCQPGVMVALGAATILSLTEDSQDIAIGWQGQHDLAQQLLVTHSLSNMLDQPACKKIVWHDLQALQSAVLGR